MLKRGLVVERAVQEKVLINKLCWFVVVVVDYNCDKNQLNK